MHTWVRLKQISSYIAALAPLDLGLTLLHSSNKAPHYHQLSIQAISAHLIATFHIDANMPASLHERQPSEQDAVSLGAWRAPSPFELNFPSGTMKPSREELPLQKPVIRVSARRPAGPKDRLSTLSNNSTSSDPGMIEDSMGWSDSDVSFDDEDSSPTVRSRSALSSPVKRYHTTPPKYNLTPTSAPLRRPDLTRPAERPMLSRSQSATTALPRIALSRSQSATSDLPRMPRSNPNLALKRPASIRSISYQGAVPTPRVPQLSSLSNCSTVQPTPSASGTSTPLYLQSPPTSATFHNEPLMLLMEKSVFEDDEDEDEEDERVGRRGLAAFASRLRIRSPSKDSHSSKRSASLGMRGVFGRKK
ncbi:hypothetical protein BP6252_05658 [Coleophoma cylindrospora]|uniref:Uncharacterized protein n=1 Tax=Coleophoma cylindrospora TaxID=1849047 RepID=A0A3D8RUC0_9HELO|nr:hypothetical protein BP6252_05658 [Coleophoma cylindrospora]